MVFIVFLIEKLFYYCQNINEYLVIINKKMTVVQKIYLVCFTIKNIPHFTAGIGGRHLLHLLIN